MQLAIDIYYVDEKAKAVGVLFNWGDESPSSVIVEWIDGVESASQGVRICCLYMLKRSDMSNQQMTGI